jgi:hypothetical protein
MNAGQRERYPVFNKEESHGRENDRSITLPDLSYKYVLKLLLEE